MWYNKKNNKEYPNFSTMNNTANNLPERSVTEQELAQYKQIVESTPVCIKVFDSAGKLIFINKGGREEHGINDTDDIAKWNWVATVKPEYRPEVLEAFKKGLMGISSRVTMEHTEEGSDHAWCEGIISPIKDENDKVTLLLFYSIDVTDREKAEAEIIKREQAMRQRNEELAEMNKILIGKDSEMAEIKRKQDEA
ncbi:hypothetical protein A2372_01885 [Candidatus Wolfebacteria bacterium RIFOXYB1_FULL_54_12]|uniref:PAC domain-containing protein n=1 Tax=Candidatus Wolfebacteria bacterium RIFOXYB1_FULL_54_12 TaxID=1802559 RepID=A0A1F8DX65_9BACT|nr:MAG: hypothetical protein A2372_01885 [Candidatus Wolfebacteria bacterium RIFOXYB1_FULL_54_12]